MASSDHEPTILWSPSPAVIEKSRLTEFSRFFLRKISQPVPNDPEACHAQVHAASIRQAGPFWRSVWEYCSLQGSLGNVDLVTGDKFQSAQWFPEGQLNFARNLLQPDRLGEPSIASAPAMIAWDESGPSTTWTRQQLYDETRRFACFLHSQGIVPGDRVVAVLPNIGQAVIAMLATTSLGAIWSSCSPDFGDAAICDRFGQIQPKILITCVESTYNGKTLTPLDRVLSFVDRLPTVQNLVAVGLKESDPDMQFTACETKQPGLPFVGWEAALASGERILSSEQTTAESEQFDSHFLRSRPFRHPYAVVYSSGTTGVPKCIVHSCGGSLIQHVKEHQLHSNLRPEDRLFFYTTTGWMMWNWLVSGLASGATIVLYDGSPFARGPETLWHLAAETQVTHFGAGARFYSTIEKQNYSPKTQFGLHKIRCVLSTGSPLMSPSFDWIYQNVGKNLNLASISGGTDLLSCFVLGNPNLPVRRGEIQCKGLGMDVHVLNERGQKILDQPGELVCCSPFPSMPIEFWNDPDGSKYHHAYFDRFPGWWYHGDWARETLHGGFEIYGRSDATLNPGGIRIGTAELYQQLEAFPEIAESLVTAVRRDGDEQIVLFIRLAAGYDLSSELVSAIRQRLRTRCSPRHVPTYIQAAPDLPRTISGKLSEIAVRNAISGTSLGNAGALANPESLAFFESWQPNQTLSQSGESSG